MAAVFHREGNCVFTYVDGNLTAHTVSNTGYEGLTPTDIMTTLVGSSGDTHDSSFGSVDDLGMWPDRWAKLKFWPSIKPDSKASR